MIKQECGLQTLCTNVVASYVGSTATPTQLHAHRGVAVKRTLVVQPAENHSGPEELREQCARHKKNSAPWQAATLSAKTCRYNHCSHIGKKTAHDTVDM